MERSLINFEEMLKNNNEGYNFIVFSRYPLVFGIPAVEHCIPDPNFKEILPLYINLKCFYDLVLKYNVLLVIWACPYVLKNLSHARWISHKVIIIISLDSKPSN